MHTLIHLDHARAVADERVRAAARASARPPRPWPPPPVRGRVAYAAARVASRLDADSARRAVA